METSALHTSSTVTTAAATAPRAEDRRNHLRAPAAFSLRYGRSGEELWTAAAFDLAAAGIGIVGEEAFDVGSEVVLAFRPEGKRGDLLTMNAVVRHTAGKRMGLQFLNVPPSDTRRLIELIGRLLRPAVTRVRQ